MNLRELAIKFGKFRIGVDLGFLIFIGGGGDTLGLGSTLTFKPDRMI